MNVGTAIQKVAEDHDIPIVLDTKALEELGLSSDTPINISLKNVSLRSFLRLMLKEHDLTYMIKDEVMKITRLTRPMPIRCVRFIPLATWSCLSSASAAVWAAA